MKYSEMKYIEKPVSRIFFGTCIPLMTKGGDACDLLDHAFSLGITAFDTARCYGKAENSLGAWLKKRNNRDKVVIQTKGGINGFLWRSRIKESCIRYDLKKSLEALGTDHTDIYLLHRDNTKVPVGDIVELLNSFVSDGRVRAFGGSNWSYKRIEQANEYAYAHGLQPFTVSSPNYGLAVMHKDPWGGGLVSVTGENKTAEREWYAGNQMPLTAWSCVGNGLFSGRFVSSDMRGAKRGMNLLAKKGFLYADNLERLRRAEILAERKGVTPLQIAVSYIKAGDMNVYPIIGTGSKAHLSENVAALSITLTAAEAAWLDLRGEDPEAKV